MRIRTLDLKAYGPFTDLVLDFTSSSQGLHVLYGPNEAGKSSSLRALVALLYGIPERTADNFLHPNDRLLIGGTLENGNGDRLMLLRRKKRKQDLLDAQENPLDQSILSQYLQGVDKEVFLALFGIDHKTLVSGGKEILAQEGHLGKTLFAAGTGLSTLKRVRQTLDQQADELFKARASKPLLNQALKEYADLQKTVRDHSLPGSQWRAHRKAYTQAEEELAQLTRKKNEAAGEVRRLQRLKQAMPLLGQREVFLERLAGFKEVPSLAADFPEQRRIAQERKRDADFQAREAKERLQEIAGQLESSSLRKELLDAGEGIETLNRGLNRYQKDLADRPRLEGNRQSLKREAGELLRIIRPEAGLEDIETLYPVLANRRSLTQLGEREQLIEQDVLHAARQVRAMETEMESTRKQLAELPAVLPVGELRNAVQTARRAGEIDKEIQDLETRETALCSSCRYELERQEYWHGELDDVPRLCLPRLATLTRFADSFAGLQRDEAALQEQKESSRKELARIETDLRAMEMASEVLTESELSEVRKHRDLGWSLLKRKWLNQEDVRQESEAYDPDRSLVQAYEFQVSKADSFADRLRREAERVHAYASLQAQKESFIQRSETFQGKEVDMSLRREKLEEKWRAAWEPCSIEPASPREMIDWLQTFDGLRNRAQELNQIRTTITAKRGLRSELRSRLEKELHSLGERVQQGDVLAPLLVQAESVLERGAAVANQHQVLRKKLEDLASTWRRAEQEHAVAKERYTSWRKEWERSLEGVGLPGSTLPGEVRDLIENLHQIREKLQEAESFRKRIEGIDRDVHLYETQVQQLLAQSAPELQGMEVELAVVRLMSLLNRARESQTLQRKLLQEQEQVTAKLHKARTAREAALKDIQKLVHTAGCGSEEFLEQAEEQWKEKRKTEEDLETVEQQLTALGEGYTIAELQRMSHGIDPDSLLPRIEELSLLIDNTLDPAIKRQHEILGEERNQLEQWDGSAEAAEAAEQAEQTLAKIRRLAERYVRLKLASRMLDQEIERYRAANQDPVLDLASSFFRELTLGSFEGIRADVNDQGVPIVTGVRADKTRVRVEGMSSGTRDQLYLALRLASLEWRLSRNEPMPFIVDDILINFDEKRAEATLSALARIAAKTQVILFTHHNHIARLAKTLGAEVQELA